MAHDRRPPPHPRSDQQAALMHRFYMPDSPAADAASVPFSPRHSQQIARVLRLRPGETVETFDGAGAICTVQLHAVAAAHTSGTVTAVRTVVRPFPWRSVLYLALLRPQRFEWAVEKAAELGAERIVPLVTARVAHGDGTVSAARLARWQHIAIEASEQCGAAFVPHVSPPLTFQRALREHAVVRLLAWEAQERTPRLETPAAAMRSLHPDADGAAPEVSIFIGPEGGFEQREVNAAIAAGCHLVSLGPNILRAETAAVAALAMLTAAWQEQRESDRR